VLASAGPHFAQGGIGLHLGGGDRRSEKRRIVWGERGGGPIHSAGTPKARGKVCTLGRGMNV